jgi:pimeloyl-ACP methyl ester carboxylesterase
VSDAQRILLYVHGIIGDTRDMAASGYRPKPIRHPALEAIATRYDLVLTFDYENLNTSIEANARSLKERLKQIGLDAGHSKTLHVVAHSMGGLVSRWFIEREGGNEVVQHLVMLGTPNAGSPWPTIQDWANAAIGLGLNGLTAVAWPAKVLGSLVAAAETIDVALDQMKPGSDLLTGLATSPDPGIPYTVLAGNTSVIPAAAKPEAGQDRSRVERLFACLRLRPALHKVASLAFFGHPNDVAVSVESISSLPTNRRRPMLVREVACDHMSYFTTQEGLQALADALPQGQSSSAG